ncbi:MAG TPA: hypothetical protein VN764_10770, partial [Polyangiaceae bacterium]|nr:hypothetical protein [Polyangiaceae bacterium]
MLMETGANAHELLNEATEWLQYSRGVTQLLAELVHESEDLDCAQMSLALDAIGAMTQRGIWCLAEG